MNLFRYISCTIFICCLCFQNTQAQIAVTNNPPYDNEENLVTDVLLGDGIIASNFSSVGFANGIGYFDGNVSNVGFNEGVILSTGGLELVTDGFGVGSGVSGDPDLELALNAINLTWPVNNVTILEFDFVAESESMAFNYVFGSVEYTSFTCSSYNDIFGFFLSGPGVIGPYSNNAVNLAYIPDPNNPGQYTTTPVAVNTINAGSPDYTDNPTCNNIDPNFEDYNIYWIDNDYTGNGWQGVNQPPSPEFTVAGLTGFTTSLTAEYNDLICGETYHIKLAIADAADGALNSAVFLEANSFASPEVQISTVPNADLGLVLGVENGVLEGCGQAAIQFDRAGDLSMDLNITLSYSGSSEYGIDYSVLPTEMVLPAFQEQVILPINVLFDVLNEGQETLIITISGVPVPCQEVTIQDIELVIFDQDELTIDMPDELTIDCLGSGLIEAFIDGGYAPYSYAWYDEFGLLISQGDLLESGIVSINQAPESNTYYSLVVSDACLDQVVTSDTDILVQEQSLSVSLDNDLLICEDEIGTININPVVVGGLFPYEYTWFYNGVVISNESSIEMAPGNGLYQVIVEEACGVIAGDEIIISFIEPSPYVDIISYDVLNPNLLPEGCFESVLVFSLLEPQSENVNLEFTLGGSAEIGLDYNISSTSVLIPAGSQSVEIPISIVVDDNSEGVENIEFNFPFIDVCSNWPSQIEVQIYEPTALFVDVENELILCEDDVDTGLIEGFVNGGVGIVNYAWYFQDEVISTEIDIQTEDLIPGTYSLIATDQCGTIAQGDVEYSVVFLSPTVQLISLDYDDPSQLYEGCGVSTLLFEMPYPYLEDTIFYFDIELSSDFYNGSDIEEIPSYIEVFAGQTQVGLDIVPLFDSYNELIESFSFSFPFNTMCSQQLDIEIVLNNYQPIVISLPDDQTICAGQSMYLEADFDGGMPPYDFLWSYNGMTESSQTATFDVQEGVFPAVFTVVDDCGFSVSNTVFIDGVDNSFFEVVWPPNEVFACFGDNSQINIVLEGGLPPFSYQWFLNGVVTDSPTPSLPWNDDNWIPGANQIVPTIPPYTPYNYTYEVLITDSCSNQLEYSIDIMVDDCLLPTSFTPNGDGNNDIFWAEFGDLVGPVSLDVFNRWGSIVFRSADYTPCMSYKSDCWDGTHFQGYGQECSEGVYYYVFTYSHPINNVDEYGVSNFVEGMFGAPHNKSLGRQRSGSVMLFR
jgi:gliding motility-associated-like protein